MGSQVKSRCIRHWMCAIRGLVVIALLLSASVVWAQQAEQQFDIPAGPLITALDRFGEQSGLQVSYDASLLQGKTASAVHGMLSATAAMQQLLRGTGLQYRFLNAQTVAVYAPPIAPSSSRTPPAKKKTTTKAGPEKQPAQLQTVTVTGSRIKGAPPTSPVIDISQEQMIQAGHTNLGEVIRSIPQNFSGGQNPGVSAGALNTNGNFNGGSDLDLRGLGQDATLTLLNGHRLAYEGTFQGVDIAAIPVAAVDRIEIIADGASAIYGSDAVAGVANVILKRDYSGASATARYGQAADGGDIERQYDLVTGAAWSTGGFIVTLDSDDNSGIKAGQRRYTSNTPPANTLLPTISSRAAVFSIHQNAGKQVTLSLDALYNRRKSDGTSITGLTRTRDEGTDYSVAPKMEIKLPAAWRLSINGLYGKDGDVYAVIPTTTTSGTYNKTHARNSISSVEVDSGGPLFLLPGGEARMAVGAGARENTFDLQYSLAGFSDANGNRHSYYAFLEAFLPLASPQGNVPFLRELSLSGAVRYEKYDDFGAVTTPKVGLLYAPTDDVDLKASWGKSFKAPTLQQEYQGVDVYLFPAALFGGSGYPSSATALLPLGGNSDLEPERATTWTTTLSFHPTSLEHFRADISYFNINYHNRVIVPVPDLLVALSDPIFQEFVTPYPTEDQQSSLIARAAIGLQNLTGAAYDPGNVVAIVDDLFTNALSQQIHGIDLFASYSVELGGGELKLNGTATWLRSRQRFSSVSPFADLAGKVFNSPHFRARLGAVWQQNSFTLAAFYNYIGGVLNTLQTPNLEGKSMQTLDLTGIYRFGSDIDLSISIRNAMNKHPPHLENGSVFVSYDSTNYSAIGRFVGISVTKRWK